MTDRRALETAPGMSFHVHARTLAVLVLASMLAGCDPASTEVGATVANFSPTGDDSGSSDAGVPAGAMGCEPGVPTIVSGTATRELGEHTWNESFVPQPLAHVSLLLVSAYPDGTYWGRAERDLPFYGLPFDFAICGDPEAAFADGGDFEVWVNVYNHDTVEVRVGDLTDEDPNAVDGPTDGLQVVLTGIEHCDAPYADDLCSTIE
jgi:hypothetical protein